MGGIDDGAGGAVNFGRTPVGVGPWAWSRVWWPGAAGRAFAVRQSRLGGPPYTLIAEFFRRTRRLDAL